MEKIVVITGSNGGIGQAICSQLRTQGFTVIGIDVAPKTTATDIYYRADLADHLQLFSCLDQIQKKYANSMYGLVNNAGVYEALDFNTLSLIDYERIMAINIRAPLFISQWFARVLRENHNKGAIVNIASISGENGSKDVAYGVSKGAIINLTKSLALALAPDIRVNTVSPGVINTLMARKIPPERIQEYESRILNQHFGAPDDIAKAVTFLLNEENQYVNNALLSVNGGLH